MRKPHRGSSIAQRKGPLCGAKLRRRDGTCTQPAGWHTDHPGFGRCSWHGGCAPSGVKAAETQRAETEARGLLAGIGEFTEATDPVAELQRLAGRAVRWLEVLESIVTDLHRIRYTAESEQIDGRIVVFERAMDRCSTILQGLARLNLDERSMRVQEAQVAILAGALHQALAETDLPAEARQSLVVRVAELVAAAEDQQAAVPARRGLTA
jgi:hypothetical protein